MQTNFKIISYSNNQVIKKKKFLIIFLFSYQDINIIIEFEAQIHWELSAHVQRFLPKNYTDSGKNI
jgi:hypothetical protein